VLFRLPVGVWLLGTVSLLESMGSLSKRTR